MLSSFWALSYVPYSCRTCFRHPLIPCSSLSAQMHKLYMNNVFRIARSSVVCVGSFSRYSTSSRIQAPCPRIVFP